MNGRYHPDNRNNVNTRPVERDENNRQREFRPRVNYINRHRNPEFTNRGNGGNRYYGRRRSVDEIVDNRARVEDTNRRGRSMEREVSVPDRNERTDPIVIVSNSPNQGNETRR